MRLYLLTVKEWDYDEFDAFLIRASSEREAREIAAHRIGSGSQRAAMLEEGQHDAGLLWKCEVLKEDGEPGEIVASFNAG